MNRATTERVESSPLRIARSAVVMFAACSISPRHERAERYERTSQGIQCTSCADTTHDYAVGIRIGDDEECSGTLIAPNLVLTARHCVTDSPDKVDCETSKFEPGHYAADEISVTTSSDISGSPSYGVSQVVVPTPTKLCGNDIALLILSANVTTVKPATPLVQYPMTDHDRTTRHYPPSGFPLSTTYVAMGYGNDGTSDAGTRRIITHVNLACIPGDATQDCGDLSDVNLDPKEWAGGDGLCAGDSGGGAYEQMSFDKDPSAPIVFGIAVRAGLKNGDCLGSAYTRTDVWSDLIIDAAKAAARAGGYSPPPWTEPVPPERVAGPDGEEEDVAKSNAGSPPAEERSDDATSGTASSPPPAASKPAPAPPRTTSSGCSVATAPRRASPWDAALFALAFLARRRRS
jgi:hypothetical protein